MPASNTEFWFSGTVDKTMRAVSEVVGEDIWYGKVLDEDESVWVPTGFIHTCDIAVFGGRGE